MWLVENLRRIGELEREKGFASLGNPAWSRGKHDREN
jgi:hypothetical protein